MVKILCESNNGNYTGKYYFMTSARVPMSIENLGLEENTYEFILNCLDCKNGYEMANYVCQELNREVSVVRDDNESTVLKIFKNFSSAFEYLVFKKDGKNDTLYSGKINLINSLGNRCSLEGVFGSETEFHSTVLGCDNAEDLLYLLNYSFEESYKWNDWEIYKDTPKKTLFVTISREDNKSKLYLECYKN